MNSIVKPGFSLTPYGNTFSINFNVEFAHRLNNVLSDCNVTSSITSFLDQLQEDLGLFASATRTKDNFHLVRFNHVFLFGCHRTFALELSNALNEFLLNERVSPALFSFAKQLDNNLNPKWHNNEAYADDR